MITDYVRSHHTWKNGVQDEIIAHSEIEPKTSGMYQQLASGEYVLTASEW